jgi:hypothetical protein
MSNARTIAELVKGSADEVVSYDDNGDVIRQLGRSEDDYIADEIIDLWSESD